MSAQGEAVVAMEKPTAMARFGERPEETTATKHSPSRTVAKDWTGTLRPESGTRGSSQTAGYKDFLAPRATVQVAMKVSNQRGGRHCNDSVRRNAGAR
jgi:hypothetical protein